MTAAIATMKNTTATCLPISVKYGRPITEACADAKPAGTFVGVYGVTWTLVNERLVAD